MRWFAILVAGVTLAPAGFSYSVLTHEAIIDVAWNDHLKPLLLRRFPGSTEEQLRKAHAYAYGGAIIQDLGYYPFGNKLVSDLLHYVRSGDFVENLIRQSQDLNEYAFALGALAHVAADIEGHSIATNPAVARIYPKLVAKCGNPVTYGCDPVAHIKVEFGFDVSQVARQQYAPEAYHDFIGFEVSRPVLERAFLETYCVEFNSMFVNPDLTLGTFRYTVSNIVPKMTKVAWASKDRDIAKSWPGVTRRTFVYNLSRASYRKEWGSAYKKPGIGTRLLALVFKLVPKVGPFHSLAFHPIDAATEGLFVRSFDATLTRYRAMLADVSRGKLETANVNLDTGTALEPGTYALADDAYARLVEHLAEKKFKGLNDRLRSAIRKYYANPNKPLESDALRRQIEMLAGAGGSQ